MDEQTYLCYQKPNFFFGLETFLKTKQGLLGILLKSTLILKIRAFFSSGKLVCKTGVKKLLRNFAQKERSKELRK
jgi:hypothetical protein